MKNSRLELFKQEIKELSKSFYFVEWRKVGNHPFYRCFTYRDPGRPAFVYGLTSNLTDSPWIEGLQGRRFVLPDEVDDIFELIDAFALL